MFKLVLLSALFAIAAAAPSGHYLHEPIAYAAPVSVLSYEPRVHHHTELAKVADIVEHVPSAVSHQSRTDYHSKPVHTPILAQVELKTIEHKPVAYTYTEPIVRAEPVVHAAPLISHHAPLLHSSPWVQQW